MALVSTFWLDMMGRRPGPVEQLERIAKELFPLVAVEQGSVRCFRSGV